MKNDTLQPVFEKLKSCPTREACVSRAMFLEFWEQLKFESVELQIHPSEPIMAALVLYEGQFARLLTGDEYTQLAQLAKLALERYRQITEPPNKVGKIIAGIFKKESI
jgi:hypothetical protein